MLTPAPSPLSVSSRARELKGWPAELLTYALGAPLFLGGGGSHCLWRPWGPWNLGREHQNPGKNGRCAQFRLFLPVTATWVKTFWLWLGLVRSQAQWPGGGPRIG